MGVDDGGKGECRGCRQHRCGRRESTSPACSATRGNRNHVAQLIAQQVLIMLHVSRILERPERPVVPGEEVPDTPRDQDSNQVVVERPPRLVASRHCELDSAHRVVDGGGQNCRRAVVSAASDHDGQSRPCQPCAETARPVIQLRLGQMVPLAAHDDGDLVAGAARVAHDLAADARGRGSSEVGPQRVATTSAQVFSMVPRQQQYPSAESILGDSQPTPVEIPLEGLTGA